MGELLVPISAAEHTLVLGTDLLFSRGTVARVRQALETAAQQVSAMCDAEGAAPITHVRIEHVWLGRDGSAPTLRPMPGGTAGDDAVHEGATSPLPADAGPSG